MRRPAAAPPLITLTPPWLQVDLGRPHQLLGWPLWGPAWGLAQHIAWLQVSNDDLPPGRKADDYFAARAAAAGVTAEIGLMTAAAIERHACCDDHAGALTVTVLATAGLSNGESVLPAAAPPVVAGWRPGTVNILVHCSAAMTQAAMTETLSIAASARTVALLDQGQHLADGRRLTGTGTDCIIVAAPPAPASDAAERFAGLHTDLGRLTGSVTYRAVQQALRRF